MEDLTFSPLPGSCIWESQTIENNATWQHECNTCRCVNGVVKCTKIWCGTGNCRSPKLTLTAPTCLVNQVCVPSPSESCLTPPCLPYGECRDLESGRRVKAPSVPAPNTCWPNQAVLSNSCARLTLLLDRAKLLHGVTVEGLCDNMRKFLAGHEAANDLQHVLVLLCDLKTDYNDTIEVTLVSKDKIVFS